MTNGTQSRKPAIPCPQCGYDVRGIAVGEACPECGDPILDGKRALLSNDDGVLALVLGILSVCSVPFFGLPAVLLGLVAVSKSREAKRNAGAGRSHRSAYGLGTAGQVLAMVGIVAGTLTFLLILTGFIRTF